MVGGHHSNEEGPEPIKGKAAKGKAKARGKPKAQSIAKERVVAANAKAKASKQQVKQLKEELKSVEGEMSKYKEKYRKFRQRHPDSTLSKTFAAAQDNRNSLDIPLSPALTMDSLAFNGCIRVSCVCGGVGEIFRNSGFDVLGLERMRGSGVRRRNVVENPNPRSLMNS